MCTTCVSTASQAASWGPPALAAGAAAVLTGVRTRFPGRSRARAASEPVATAGPSVDGAERSLPTP